MREITVNYLILDEYEERLKKQAENTIYQDGDVLIVK